MSKPNKPKLNLEDIPMENGCYVVELTSPIEAHGETVSRLLIKEPKVGHLRVMDKINGDVAKSLKLISELASIPNHSVDAITMRDLNTKIQPVLDAIMGESPETGET